jgi:neutral cholesterol ester hydrolase 1
MYIYFGILFPGDSAGGNLAMAAALKLSTETGLPSLKFMSLDYPALQAFDFDLPCYQLYSDGPGILTKRGMIVYWLLYAFGNLDYLDLFFDNSHTRELQDSAYADYVDKKFLPADIRESVHDAPNEHQKVDKNDPQKPIPEEIIKIITDPLYAPLLASDEQLQRLPPTYMFIVEFDVLRDDGLIAARRLENAGVKVTQRFMETEEHGYLSHVSMDPTVLTEINRFAKFFNQTLGIYE